MSDTHDFSRTTERRVGLEPLSELTSTRIWGMLESAPDGMLMTDRDGVMLAVNGQVERLFGYDRGDLLGRSIEMLLPDRFRDVHRAHRTRYNAAPSVRAMGAELELLARRNDGSEFPVEVSLSPLEDHGGLAIVASIRDVSEQRAKSAKAERVQAAINAVHDGVFIFDAETLDFVYVNDGACTQTGYTSDELLTMTPLHIKPEFTKDSFVAILAPLVEGEADHHTFRTVHRRKDGRDVPVEITLEYGVHGEGGALLTAVVRDITDREEIERRLEQSEKFFRASFEHAPVGMVVSLIDQNGVRVIEQVNDAFARMLGRSPDDLVGVDIDSLTHPDDADEGTRAAALMAQGAFDRHTVEKRYVRADGSFVWTLLQASVVERSDQAVSVAHVVDITDRRERQAQRARMITMEDRDRIGRDLHDLVIQRLFAAGMKLQSVIPEMGSEVAVQRTHETIEELDATIRELRSAIYGLHERDRSRSTLEEIRSCAAAIVPALGFEPDLDVAVAVDSLPPDVVEHLLSTMREALSNVARHAQAHSVSVSIAIDDDTVAMEVVDDGVGIAEGVLLGNGLSNMAERAERLGGSCEAGASSTGGTRLSWSVPVLRHC